MRGYGPDSNTQGNVFLGSKTLEALTYDDHGTTKYYKIGTGDDCNLGTTVQGYGNDPWSINKTESKVSYNFYIKYNGEARFKYIKDLNNVNQSNGGYNTIGLSWNGSEDRTTTTDYFWKNSLYTMRCGNDNHGYVGFLRGFGSNSYTDHMTFIGALETKDNLSEFPSISADSGDFWSKRSGDDKKCDYTFRIDIDGNAKFHTLEVEEAETSYTDDGSTVKSSRLLPKIYNANKGQFLKVNDSKKAEWADLPNNNKIFINHQVADTAENYGSSCNNPFLKFYDYKSYKASGSQYTLLERIKFAQGTGITITGQKLTYESKDYLEIKISMAKATTSAGGYVVPSTEAYTASNASEWEWCRVDSDGKIYAHNTTYSMFAGSASDSTSKATTASTDPYIISRSSGNVNSSI